MYTPCTVTFCSYCEHSNKMPKGNESSMNVVCRQFVQLVRANDVTQQQPDSTNYCVAISH